MSRYTDMGREELERLLRKNRNTLVIVGEGVIAFGLWNVIKILLSIALVEETRQSLLYDSTTGEALPLALIVIGVIIILGLMLALRLFVGLSAVSEGRGRRRYGYLVFVALMVLLDSAALAATFFYASDPFDSVMDAVITVVVELTSIVMLAELFASGIRVKSLSRQLEKRG